jgi:hypothetical protein
MATEEKTTNSDSYDGFGWRVRVGEWDSNTPLLLGNLGVSGGLPTSLPTSRNHGWRMSGTCASMDLPSTGLA